MSSKKKHGKKLVTDKNTDFLFDYFMNEEKFNEQLRGEWDEKIEKNLEKAREPKLNNHIVTDRNTVKNRVSSDIPVELPSISQSGDRDVEFNDDITENSIRSDDENFTRDDRIDENSLGLSSAKSPYYQKINAIPNGAANNIGMNNAGTQNREFISERPLLGDKLIGNLEKFAETPEEKRARQRDAYSQLQDLVQKYNVKLTRHFNIDDEPDEMEEEVKMHKDRRHKSNQVKFYKQMLLNIVCGVEFINDKYNPFEFKMKDWSKQIAGDMDDYTEVLEEIYEKYRDKGGKMAPEIRLLFMIIMSGVTYHLSNTLFGSGGLDTTIQNNPNLLNKFLGGMMKGGGIGSLLGNTNDAEPAEAVSNNSKNILAAIRKQNQTKRSEANPDTNMVTETDHDKSSNNDALIIERERRILAEQRATFEEQLRKQNEMYNSQLQDLRQQLNNSHITSIQQTPNKQIYTPPNKQIYTPPGNLQKNIARPSVNLVLSDATRKPRFLENPFVIGNTPNKSMIGNRMNGGNNMNSRIIESISESGNNESEFQKNSAKKRLTNASIKNPLKNNYDELLESLEQSSDIDLDDIIESSTKKKDSKSIPTTKRPKNNSAARSTIRRSDARSDILSTGKRNVIKL